MEPALPTWRPGEPVDLSFEGLQVRTLQQEDVSDDPDELLGWYGDDARRAHVWAPPLPNEQYLRGLIQACDQVSFFAFLILKADTSEKLGFAKAQLVQDGKDRLFIPTVVIGPAGQSASKYGLRSVVMLSEFAFRALDVSAVSVRVYRENRGVIRLALRFGMLEHSCASEDTAQGLREVVDLRLSHEAFRGSPLRARLS